MSECLLTQKKTSFFVVFCCFWKVMGMAVSFCFTFLVLDIPTRCEEYFAVCRSR